MPPGSRPPVTAPFKGGNVGIQGFSRAGILIFLCAVFARIRRLCQSPQYLLVILQWNMTVSANLRNSTQNFHNNCADKYHQNPGSRDPLGGHGWGCDARFWMNICYIYIYIHIYIHTHMQHIRITNTFAPRSMPPGHRRLDQYFGAPDRDSANPSIQYHITIITINLIIITIILRILLLLLIIVRLLLVLLL